MNSKTHIDRRGIPKADGFQLGSCGDPECGPHILALDRSGAPMCEIVLSRNNAVALISELQAILYGKAAGGEG